MLSDLSVSSPWEAFSDQRVERRVRLELVVWWFLLGLPWQIIIGVEDKDEKDYYRQRDESEKEKIQRGVVEEQIFASNPTTAISWKLNIDESQ
jgi:hypothetical protein